MGLSNEPLLSFPPKTLEQVVLLVSANRSEEIHIFEWLDVLESKQQWDVLSDDILEQACIAVWTGIACHKVLGDIAFFKIGLSLDGKPSSIVTQLVDTMAIARCVPQLDELVKQKIDWLILLQQGDDAQLAKYCRQLNRTVSSTIRWLRLPQMNSYEGRLIKHLCTACSSKSNDSDDKWLAENFLALQTTQQRINFLEQIIIFFENRSLGKRCKQFVEQYCLPTKPNSYWGRLSVAAQSLLKSRFKLSNYYNLYSVSSALYSQEAEEVLGLSEDERRQIRSRSMFWSNYSTRFSRLRVLLPERSYKFISDRNGKLPNYINQFSSVDSHDSEVFIFELEKIIAVEFLRGVMSETRFFNRNDWNSQRLFDNEELTALDIRAMSQLEVHDHLVGWQYFCEKLLRTKFKLVPNDDIPYFRGLPKEVNTYTAGVGLPRPYDSIMIERKRSLESWVERFWSSELATGKFGSKLKADDRSQLYMAKAFIAKQMGEQLEFESYMKKAADHGNTEAMWQLGKTMLLNPQSGPHSKKQGEEWIAKAAGRDHQEASATCKRFGFAPI